MKERERSDKIKKLLIVFLIIIFPYNYVKATENVDKYPDVTKDIEIRYKWYKEVVSEEGEYVPLKNISKNDIIDKNKFKYVGQNIFNEANCNMPTEYYQISEKIARAYKRTYTASYVLIENIEPNTEIEIYSNNKLIQFKIIGTSTNAIKINLLKTYFAESLLFYINTEQKYKISIYHDLNLERLIVSKEIENKKISIPDKTWITDSTEFYTYISYTPLEESDLNTLISLEKTCSSKEKYVYKYNTYREYYDDNYYLNVENYTKDETDYRYYYKGEPITITNTITNTVEVIKEKIIKEPKIKYVYIERENKDTEKNEPSKEQICSPETKTEIKTKIIEKEIIKTPRQIYIIIIILFAFIAILCIKIYKKYVE